MFLLYNRLNLFSSFDHLYIVYLSMICSFPHPFFIVFILVLLNIIRFVDMDQQILESSHYLTTTGRYWFKVGRKQENYKVVELIMLMDRDSYTLPGFVHQSVSPGSVVIAVIHHNVCQQVNILSEPVVDQNLNFLFYAWHLIL